MAAEGEGTVTSISVDSATAQSSSAIAYFGTAAGNIYQALVDMRSRQITLQLVQSAHPASITAVTFPEAYGEVCFHCCSALCNQCAAFCTRLHPTSYDLGLDSPQVFMVVLAMSMISVDGSTFPAFTTIMDFLFQPRGSLCAGIRNRVLRGDPHLAHQLLPRAPTHQCGQPCLQLPRLHA